MCIRDRFYPCETVVADSLRFKQATKASAALMDTLSEHLSKEDYACLLYTSHSDFSAGKRFILVHMAAAYAYGSSDAFYGTNATGQELAMDIDRKSTRLNSSHLKLTRMPSSA